MLTVVYENDQHSREVLTAMLRELGFDRVHATRSLDETIYFLEKEHEQIDLIIAAHGDGDGLDFPISRVILRTPELERCPLVVLTEDWRNVPLSPFKARLSRVDQAIARAFGRTALAEGIARAFESRARFRNTLAYYGSRSTGESLEEEILSSRGLQWKKLETFQDAKRLLDYLNTVPLRLGGIVFEADANLGEVAHLLRQFKRSRYGSWVPIACLGQDPAALAPFVTFLDLSFAADTDWSEVLEVLSLRSAHDWRVSQALSGIRDSLKKNEIKNAKKLLKIAKQSDSRRWELLEIEGAIYQNPALLRKALSTQPCSPAAYLKLLPMVSKDERKALLDKSALYCPRHPGLLALRK